MSLWCRARRLPDKGWVGAVVVAVVVLSGGCVGVVSPPTAPQPTPPTPTNATPAPAARDVTVRFCRLAANNSLFRFNAHDPLLVRSESGDLYLIATVEHGQHPLWVATDESGLEWRMDDRGYLPPEPAYDSIVRVDGRYLVYGNDYVYASDDLATGDWERVGITPQNDLGAYYDGERVHIYYERGDDTTSEFSGSGIGHASSPTGTGNWTVHDPVFTVPGPYGVGDFEVVRTGQWVVIVGDYSTSHPRYEQAVWVGDSFDGNFTMLSRPAIGPADDGSLDGYGVGDPALAALDDGRHLMVANGHPGQDGPAYLHAYVGSVGTGPTPGACASGGP